MTYQVFALHVFEREHCHLMWPMWYFYVTFNPLQLRISTIKIVCK